MEDNGGRTGLTKLSTQMDLMWEERKLVKHTWSFGRTT